MRRIRLFGLISAGLSAALGCGGHAVEPGASAGSAAGGAAGVAAEPSGGSRFEPGSSGGTDPTVPEGGDTPGFYVPDTTVPYDGTTIDGSFEDGQGFGWDFCSSHTPESSANHASGGSHGQRFLSFASAAACTSFCAPDAPAASEVYFWLESGATLATPASLYFDIENLRESPADGVLRFYGTDLTCGAEQLLVEVELAQLELTNDWSTRCVTLPGFDEHRAIGLAVTGGNHEIGIDAVRPGPACHASPRVR